MQTEKTDSITLRFGKDASEREKIISKTPGLVSSEQVFPDRKDDMAGLYVLKVKPEKLGEALAYLQRVPGVTHADLTSTRRLQ